MSNEPTERLIAAVKRLLDTVGSNGAWSIEAELEELGAAYAALPPDPWTARGKQWLREGAPVGENFRTWHEANPLSSRNPA